MAKISAALALRGMFSAAAFAAVALVSNPSPGKADARCTTSSHTDYHWAYFHNDTHRYASRYRSAYGRWVYVFEDVKHGTGFARVC